jgi:aryl-alcohol dehydrogenase-like predicted oxidoreductase
LLDATGDLVSNRPFGATGQRVGAVGLGCMGMSWVYGGERIERESLDVIRRALDLGSTLLDTADVYGPFTNEELVGRAIAGRREDAVVATKCGLIVEDVASVALRRDGTPTHIHSACEASLDRLGVDVIDLFYLHRVDPDVPVEESVGAMGELVEAGKVRAIGLSEVTLDELTRAQAVHPLAAVQMELSLWTRDPLREILPWCEEHDVSFVAYAPLGRGFLTGAITTADSLDDEDWRRQLPRFDQEALDANRGIVEVVRAIAERQGATPGQVSIAWVLAQSSRTIAIPGTRRIAYLEENVGAAGLRLEPEDLAALDALPEPVGDRYAAHHSTQRGAT